VSTDVLFPNSGLGMRLLMERALSRWEIHLISEHEICSSPVGLTQIRMLPQVSSFNRGPNFQNWQTQALSVLAKEEVVQWRAAVAQVESEGTFFIGQPFHCAVGTKP
jgi:hypothetical protein